MPWKNVPLVTPYILLKEPVRVPKSRNNGPVPFSNFIPKSTTVTYFHISLAKKLVSSSKVLLVFIAEDKDSERNYI